MSEFTTLRLSSWVGIMGLLPFFAQILVSVGTILKIASSANPQVMLHQGCCPHAHVIPILPWLFLQAFIHILLYVPGYPGWTTRNRSVVQTRESTFPIAFHILAHGSWCHSTIPAISFWLYPWAESNIICALCGYRRLGWRSEMEGAQW